MLKKVWRAETGFFLCIWLGLMIGGRTRFFHDPGTYWHTVVGQHILSSHHFLDTDPFSFTFAGHPWVPYEWLGECVMAVIHKIDGLDSLLVATVTILACLYTWVAHRLIRCGLHWSLAALAVGLTMAASSSHFHVRPHIGTIVLLGVTFAMLVDFEAGRIGFRRLLWLVPLFVLWTNLHGGMLGGLGTLVLALGGWCLARIIGWPTPLVQARHILAFSALVVACGLTALVNPYGPRLPETWLLIMKMPHLPALIQEHGRLNPWKPDGWTVLLFGVVYLLMLAGILPRRPRVTWLLPLVWFCLACSRVRHAPLFSLTAALALADMLPHTRWAAWLARPGSDLFQFPGSDSGRDKERVSWRAGLLPLAVVLAAFGLQAGRVPVLVLGHGWAQLDPTEWPVEVKGELEQFQDSRPGGTPIFNEYQDGGFLIYYTPGFRVFVDDRCEVYGDEWLLDFVQAETVDTAGHVADWERRYGSFNFALTRTGSGYDSYFSTSPDWGPPVKRTDTATLYRRKSVPDQTSAWADKAH